MNNFPNPCAPRSVQQTTAPAEEQLIGQKAKQEAKVPDSAVTESGPVVVKAFPPPPQPPPPRALELKALAPAEVEIKTKKAKKAAKTIKRQRQDRSRAPSRSIDNAKKGRRRLDRVPTRELLEEFLARADQSESF